MKFLQPNKTKLLVFGFLILFFIARLLFFIFLGGDPLNSDRGHESYSGTKISEVYDDVTNSVLSYTLYLPFTLLSRFNHVIDFGYVIIIMLFYWYLLSCLGAVLYPKIKKEVTTMRL